MDQGTWTFRCRKCGGAFELTLTERQHAADFAKNHCCPSCGSLPSEATQGEAMRGDVWHKVIGYRGHNSHPIKFP